MKSVTKVLELLRRQRKNVKDNFKTLCVQQRGIFWQNRIRSQKVVVYKYPLVTWLTVQKKSTIDEST